MYKIFSLVFCLCASIAGYAHSVTQAEALRIATDFSTSHIDRVSNAKSARQTSPTLTLAYACKSQSERAINGADAVCYYIYNVGKGCGFVVVPGDDRARQVLAYSDEGSFDADHVSPVLSEWLHSYERELSLVMSIAEGDETETSAKQTITYPTETILPLIKTKWNQGIPYNRDCPLITENGTTRQALVGCTATALAQIMKYYEWPEKPTGFIDYQDNYAVRTMDFDAQLPFNWTLMLNDYSGYYSDEEANAVAQLSACAAYACKMYFSTSYSGSYPIDAALALSQYFGYDANTYIYDSRFHDKAEWLQLMMEELESGRPILYNGFNDKGGHVFVCDGYDGKGYFHFNWGWSGSSDGYFSLSALKPGQQGAGSTDGGYTFKQLMICHIQRPDATLSVPQEKKVYICSDVTLSSESQLTDGNIEQNADGANAPIATSRGADVGVDFWFDRESTSEFNVSMVMGYMEQGTLHPLSDVYNAKCTPNPNSYYAGVRTLKTNGLATGEYEIGWYFREYGSNSEWKRMTAANGNPDAILLTVEENRQTLQVVNKDFRLSLNGDVKVQPIYAGEQKLIPLPINNDGSVRLEGRVGFKIQKVGSEDVTFASALAYCEPGESATLNVNVDFTNASQGDEYILTPVYGAVNNIYYNLSETNMVALSSPQNIVVGYKPSISAWAPNNTNYILDGTSKTVEITLSQSSKLRPWSGKVYGKILKQVGSGYEDTGVEAWSDLLDMPTRQDIHVRLHMEDIDKLQENCNYKMVLRIDDGYGSDGYGTALHEAPLVLENLSSCIDLPIYTEGYVSVFKLDGTCVLSHVDLQNGHLNVSLPSGSYVIKVSTPTTGYSKKIIIK